ncbi:MAG: hypothetical protein EOL87_11045 [Spartobacteria bacterium]|nr:hypothetical protein [Spartobacteria bacterium]
MTKLRRRHHQAVSTGLTASEYAAQLIVKSLSMERNHHIISVGGPGGIGKSTFSQRLAEHLKNASVLHLDDYKRSRSSRAKECIFGAHPRANRIQLLLEHLRCISNGTPFEKPVYDSVRGVGDRTERFTPEKVVILDGEIASYSQFLPFIDFSIFIDAHWETQFATRLTRDTRHRGHSHAKAVSTFVHSNVREFGRYGAHTKKWADLLLFCLPDYQLIVDAVNEQLL